MFARTNAPQKRAGVRAQGERRGHGESRGRGAGGQSGGRAPGDLRTYNDSWDVEFLGLLGAALDGHVVGHRLHFLDESWRDREAVASAKCKHLSGGPGRKVTAALGYVCPENIRKCGTRRTERAGGVWT